MELIPTVDLLREKKGSLKEAHLILFEYCNLRCSFCHQDHESMEGYDTIMDKVDTLIASVDVNDPYVINMTGGELFLDKFSDEVFELYYQAGKRLLESFTDAFLVLGTNLVYQRIDRLMELVDRLSVHGNVQVATSYDPAGRFDSKSRDLFFRNLFVAKEYITTVNVVITKQNIEAFLTGREGEEVAWMCDNFNVYFDHYIPSHLYEYIQPDEDLIGQLYLTLNEKYPNSYPIKAWKQNQFNDTTCRSTKIVNRDGVVTTCWSEAGKDSILDEAEGLLAKDEAEIKFVEHYDCFSCEYYSRCGLRCFLHDTVLGEKSKECSIKVMFDQILD